MPTNVLVTGGAGYIGSHTVAQLRAAGYAVVVYDNLSTGFREAVPGDVALVPGDIRESALLTATLRERQITAVVHFAAKIVVPESMTQPYEYYDNNTGGVLSLIKACRDAAVRHVVFSSTAAVYGNPRDDAVISEDHPTLPINPYGHSKRMSEQMLQDAGAAYGLRCVVLRYFNVAGASIDGANGQRSPHATHLIKIASQVAAGKRERMQLFGTDYPTADGTAVRDYIHVDDLADIHLQALRYLETGVAGTTFNCGYGHGYSVRDVIATMQRVSGRTLCVEAAGRRPGDAARLIADPTKLQRTMGWKPQYDDLELICRTAYEWERRWSV